jgi:hypothetical protein
VVTTRTHVLGVQYGPCCALRESGSIARIPNIGRSVNDPRISITDRRVLYCTSVTEFMSDMSESDAKSGTPRGQFSVNQYVINVDCASANVRENGGVEAVDKTSGLAKALIEQVLVARRRVVRIDLTVDEDLKLTIPRSPRTEHCKSSTCVSTFHSWTGTFAEYTDHEI